MNKSNMSLLDKLINVHHVVGYHLPISPTNYQVDIHRDKNDHMIIMVSHYDVSPKDTCGIPFCCLLPLCHRRKHVTDHFNVDEELSTLTLESTSAFGGLISCFEKGKVFQVIRNVSHYMILVNPKEIFVLSPYQDRPSVEDQLNIDNAIEQINSSSADLPIKYL
jgi:hypothetical protein